MTTEVAAVPATASVRDAARLMLARRISALPVVDGKDRMIGIVSEGDLMRRAELGTDAEPSWWLQLFADQATRHYLRSHAESVRDVMTSPVVSVRRTTSLKEVARLLEKHRIKRVPVLADGHLVGIVSRADLVRKLATAPVRPEARTGNDRALRRAVTKEVASSGVDARFVNITVEHRTVHLWGSVRSNSDQKVLGVAARSVSGVRRVENHTSVMPLRASIAIGAT